MLKGKKMQQINKLFYGLIFAIIVSGLGCAQKLSTSTGISKYSEPGVAIQAHDNFYKVTLDYTTGLSPREMGEAYGRAILAVVPDYESLVDSYLDETIYNNTQYHELFLRLEEIKPQVPIEYCNEIEGIAATFRGRTQNILGDNRLSIEEFYLWNLYPDVFRATQCCFVSVFGARSATGKTSVGRNLDWFGGKQNQLPKLQAIITIHYPERSICLIGYLGFMGVLTGFNDCRIFAAILDSSSGAAYSALGKRSYPLDLRYALERQTTLTAAVQSMMDPTRYYSVNHLIAFADSKKSIVLENNFSGTGPTKRHVRRGVRTANSRLNKGISWGINDAIGSVNSFMLYGNHDNHTNNKFNTKRWKNLKKQLQLKGEKVTVTELKQIVSYDNGSPGTFMDSGDLYNKMTQHIVIFEPDNFSLEVFFHPVDTLNSPKEPHFQKVAVF